MDLENSLTYVTAFIGSLAVAWAVTPLALRLASRTGIVDAPSTAAKGHAAPVPYLGGAAIVLAFSGSVVCANLIVRPEGGLGDLTLILGLAVGLALMGLLDDLRGLGPALRLGLEAAAALALVASGVSVQIFDLSLLNAAVTIVWIVGLTNAFNLLDNMDGLSAGVAAIAALSFFVIAAINGQFLVASLSIALAGCALGFLRHNFHPARIYMGDAGSLFLGFTLAVIGLKLRFNGPTSVTFLVPILVCGIAIFDTALVTIERLRHGRTPLSGGRDHTSHRLTFIGLPVTWAVTSIYTAAMALGWIALLVSRIDRTSAYLLTALVIVLSFIIGRLLSAVPVYGPNGRLLLGLREQNDDDAARSAWAAGASGRGRLVDPDPMAMVDVDHVAGDRVGGPADHTRGLAGR
jgi:UDP-GlcNAc:undecaprenyl-phosphate/decaprenyl-phosphate GlcNAc-1-phosphate transferase